MVVAVTRGPCRLHGVCLQQTKPNPFDGNMRYTRHIHTPMTVYSIHDIHSHPPTDGVAQSDHVDDLPPLGSVEER